MVPAVLDILKECEERLLDVDSPRLSAEVLIAEVLGCTRLSLVLERERRVTEEQYEKIHELIHRRSTGEPLAYILGRKEFYGFDFKVSPDTLIPRPETEHIVELVESFYTSNQPFHFADLGTGSGILAVTLAVLFPASTGVAVDLSRGALDVALKNAQSHGVSARLAFQCCDFRHPLFSKDMFDLIVTNPPYVTEAELRDASHEVRDFEPETALVSGVDGLDHFRALLPTVDASLKSDGICLVEIGFEQADDVKKIMSTESSRFKDVKIYPDLAGLDRVVFFRKQ